MSRKRSSRKMLSLCTSRKSRRLAALRAIKNKENKNPNVEQVQPGCSKNVEAFSTECNTEVPVTELVIPTSLISGDVESECNKHVDHMSVLCVYNSISIVHLYILSYLFQIAIYIICRYHKSNVENVTAKSIYAEPATTCSTDVDIQKTINTTDDIITEETEMQSINVSSISNVEGQDITGRRIFDVKHLFNQILTAKKHKPFDCSIIDMDLVKESRKGLYSTFLLKCRMCNKFDSITTKDLLDNSQMNLNTSITFAAVSTGLGHSQLEQIAAVCNMPMMTNKTFSAYHENIADVVLQTVWKSMESAAKEIILAKNEDQIDPSDDLPCITVVTDGAWAKRAYNVHYRSKV